MLTTKFFKPTVAKILIFILFAFLLARLPIDSLLNIVLPPPCAYPSKGVLPPILCKIPDSYFLFFNFFNILIPMFTLLITYVLSCTVIFFIARHEKKQKKRQ